MFKRINYKKVIMCTLAGITTGIIISLFRIGIEQMLKFTKNLLNSSLDNNNPLIFLLFYIFLGILVSFFLKIEPLISGSGIPQVNGELQGKINFSWPRVLIAKFTAGILSIGSGLTLGREGPSVQVGSAVGKGIAVVNNFSEDDKNLFTAGTSAAGMSVAFNAPVASLIFSIEELLKKTSDISFLYISTIVIFATGVSHLILGNKPVMELGLLRNSGVPIHLIILFGIVIGISGVIFNKSILLGKSLYEKVKLPNMIKHVFPFLITGVILIFNQKLFGSGESLILLPLNENPSVNSLVISYIVKFFLLMFAFCSGLPGGIFFPLLSLGALLGNIFGSLLGPIYGLEYFPVYFTLIGMSAHFSAIVRAPLTGILLITEMTAAPFESLFSILLCSYTAYFVAKLLGSEPIYESLLDLIVKKEQNN